MTRGKFDKVKKNGCRKGQKQSLVSCKCQDLVRGTFLGYNFLSQQKPFCGKTAHRHGW
jgi:hypothetical protein